MTGCRVCVCLWVWVKATHDKEAKDLMAPKEAKVTPDGLWGGQWAHTTKSPVMRGVEGSG